MSLLVHGGWRLVFIHLYTHSNTLVPTAHAQKLRSASFHSWRPSTFAEKLGRSVEPVPSDRPSSDRALPEYLVDRPCPQTSKAKNGRWAWAGCMLCAQRAIYLSGHRRTAL